MVWIVNWFWRFWSFIVWMIGNLNDESQFCLIWFISFILVFPFWYLFIFQVGFDGTFYLECESSITTESDMGLERTYEFYDNTTGAKLDTDEVNCTSNVPKCKGTYEVKSFKQASASYHCTESFKDNKKNKKLTLYSAVTTVTFDWSKFLCFNSNFIIVITLIHIL